MTQLHYWLAATYLPNIGPGTILSWLETFKHIQSLFTSPPEALLAAGLKPDHILKLKHPNWQAIDKDLNWATQHPNRYLITLDDPHYPQQLKQISYPPLVLYIQGNLAALQNQQIAIVGSRNPTPSGLANAYHFAKSLVTADLTITSGLARGIDGAAHRGAIEGNGTTIAVCGTGLNHIYPKSHVTLHSQILSNNGAIVSEFPLDTQPHATNFPRRNRIIAGLSCGILIVEAALKSGSLITARYALDQGREVFTIPGSIHNPLSRGCHHLLRQGAALVESPEDIFQELGITQKKPLQTPVKTDQNITLPSAHRQLLAHIGHEITPLDVILCRSRLTASEVSSILLVLELKGYIQSMAGGYIRTPT